MKNNIFTLILLIGALFVPKFTFGSGDDPSVFKKPQPNNHLNYKGPLFDNKSGHNQKEDEKPTAMFSLPMVVGSGAVLLGIAGFVFYFAKKQRTK